MAETVRTAKATAKTLDKAVFLAIVAASFAQPCRVLRETAGVETLSVPTCRLDQMNCGHLPYLSLINRAWP